MRSEHVTDLEKLVDEHGLSNVLEVLAGICSDKAQHIFANYQDDILSDNWSMSGLAISRASVYAEKKGL